MKDKYYITKITTPKDAETTLLVGKPPKDTVTIRFNKIFPEAKEDSND